MTLNMSYDYRKSRFIHMNRAWELESMHELMSTYTPTPEDLEELRFSMMLYISRALYFNFTDDEKEFIIRLDKNRHIRDNVTPNGGVVPKKEYQLEYNMVLRIWSKIAAEMVKRDPSLLNKFRLTPNIRIKFGTELEENVNRTLNTSWPHSDAWVEGPWSMNCYVPLLGDVVNNNLAFWKPKNPENFSDNFLNTAATYEEMQWVLDHYVIDEKLKPQKGKVHISDYALIHATSRKDNCGTRVSIDTTVCVGDHDVHADRETEYLNSIETIGEELFVSVNRSTKDNNIIDKKTTFSHYTTGNLKVHNFNE